MTTINVCSPTFAPAESYGRIALEISDQFARMGHYVNRLGGFDPAKDGDRFRLAMGGILLGYPTLWELYTPLVNRGVRLALTMFESTILPEGWVERLNQADGIVVPSVWQVKVFRDNGITKPIRVIPLGISEAFCQPKKREVSDPFTFIAFADRGYRKGWWHAVQAFVQAFGSSPKHRLILKTREAEMKGAFSNANIEVVTDQMDDAGLVSLYHRSHVMLASNCAEGFGFLAREFAGTGGVSMATNFGGTADDLHWWGLPIPYTMGTAWPDDDLWHGKLGKWAEPDIPALVALMRHVAEHYTSYTDFGIQAAGFVRSNYRWQVFSQQVCEFWQELTEARYGSNSQRSNPLSA